MTAKITSDKKMLREGNYKIGRLHGKLQADNPRSEAQIQRTVFLSQKIRLWKKRNETVEVRIFGYEMPLKSGCTRGECVDLVGYDKDHTLYLIELKKKDSSERIGDIIEQLNDYEDAAKWIIPAIEVEFEKEYFLPISFKGIKKIILAPREFYNSRKKELTKCDIGYCYFRDGDVNKREPGEVINIHFVKS